MTAELNNDAVQTTNGVENTQAQTTSTAEHVPTLPSEIAEIFEFLSLNTKIVFKSQQIDDPEIQRSEKVQIARELYTKNRETFLLRFGAHFEERHLETFARLALADGAAPLRSGEHCEEMQFMLKDFQRKLHTRQQDVKNRRYTALQQLIEKGEYFGEQEMMQRSPELYQELIGQYLSETEKKQRDSYDVRNTTFSGILMHTLEQQQLGAVLQQVVDGELQDDSQPMEKPSDLSFSNSNNVLVDTELTPIVDDVVAEVPPAFRQQWGNFDNEQIACSTSRGTAVVKAQQQKPVVKPIKVKAAPESFITAGERELLRQEFIGLMHEQFLAGNDKDFDYTQVDDNSQLDDLRQLNQDKEDAYFEDSEEEEPIAADDDAQDAEIKHMQQDSEDELDIYMNHLSKHHSLQQKM